MPFLGESNYPDMPFFVAGAEVVKKLLENLNPHKASGPDNIQTRFLKEYATTLTFFLMPYRNRVKFHQTGRRLTFHVFSRKETVVIQQTAGLFL
ncbi:hypothetical protein DPMN_044775 [Dreissena polymorpha]|uniref:Uncharacterized protein n=1 Tax=Dreissena polymorpha TaxID=45954 RepID=A0A9D4D4S0_DREPO|nr:hypothetical protein DPMN_044775 [Dreissena polymorpha]